MNTIKKSQAFTIVELLIVIVIIAILAAITLVAYNGITARAEQSANFSAVKSYTQTLQLLKADTGSLPVANSCLGPAGTYPGGTCSFAGQNGTVNATTNSQLALYGMSVGSQPAIKSNGKPQVVIFATGFYGEPTLLYTVRSGSGCMSTPSRMYIDATRVWADGVTKSADGGTGTLCYLSLRDL